MAKRANIGMLKEQSLHADLKRWLAEPEDELESWVDGYVIDVRKPDILVEIQTRHFSSLRPKLKDLLPSHRVQLFHPIPRAKWIVRQDADGGFRQRRKSPKKGKLLEIFRELVYIPQHLSHPNLSIGVLLTEEEEIWRNDGQGSWRRKKWSIVDRKLLRVVRQHVLGWPEDYLQLLPASLEIPFTNKELAAAIDCRTSLATKITYTLRHAGVLDVIGKRGNANLHQVV